MHTTLRGRTIRCILFDLGETLWTHVDQDTWHTLEREANERALTILRAHIAEEAFATLEREALGNQLRQVVQVQTRSLTQLRPGYEPDFARAVNGALLQLGLPLVDNAVGEAVFDALRIPIAESRICFEDALDTLRELRTRGFLLGVVSNRHWGGPSFLEGVQKLGLFEYFPPEHMAISADLGIRKPNPAIFLHTLRALQVEPEEAAMVGDSLRSDVAGAKHLGIFAIWKPKPIVRAELRAQTPGKEPDADTLIDYVTEQENKKYQQIHERVVPDLIIEQLRDLLNVFQKAGQQ